MRYTKLFGALILSMLLTTSVLPERSAHAQPTQDEQVYLPLIGRAPSLAQQVIALVNVERAKIANCPALQARQELMIAAEQHSVDMGQNNIFRHNGSNGSTPGQRLSAMGYLWTSYAENIAAGQSSAQSVMTSWMGSPPHRANILNCQLRDIGVGYYYDAQDQNNVQTSSGLGGPFFHYWTQDFGTTP